MPLPPPPPPASGSHPQHGSRSEFTAPSGTPASGPRSAPPTLARCYRHADRDTGRRCTRCGKHACDQCLVQASVGSHCLDCAKASRPDIKTRARFWSAGQPNLVTMSLVGLNAAVFVAVLIWTRSSRALSGGITTAHFDFGLNKALLQFGSRPGRLDGSVVSADPNEWYRLVTSGFLHFGIIHLALNCYFIYVLGPMLEQPLGRVRYALLYFASLLGGSLGVLLLDGNGISAGASGAAFGLLAAAAIGLWQRGINPLTTSIGAVLIMNLFITFAIPNISIGGHLGGAVAGALCALVMLAPGHKAFPRWATYAAPIAVGVGSVVASVLLVATA